jgi:endothelin-converting enzyme/putative endopeptidase
MGGRHPSSRPSPPPAQIPACDTLPSVTRATLLVLLALRLGAQERPLASLPDTPSLEPAFLDRAADPCVDFYRFACGNWSKLNPIPPDQPRWEVYGKLQNDNRRYLWGILEEVSKPTPGRTPNEQKIGDYFAACMDEAAVEKAGAAPLGPRLSEIAALKNVAGLAPLVGRLHLESSGDGMLFGFGSAQDFADSSRVIAYASAGGLGLPDRDYYVKTDPKSVEIRARYLAHVARMLSLLGDDAAAAEAGARVAMEIETELAKASLTLVEKRDPHKLFHKMPLAEFQKSVPSFGWAAYFDALGIPAPPVVNVAEPAFYREMEALLKTRSLDDWKTYLRWHLVDAKARYLSSAFVQADYEFNRKYLRGTKELAPRWKRCVSRLDYDLGEAIGQVFVARTFSPETKARTLAMVKEIEWAMEEDIDHIAWMGEATRQRALAKLHAVVNRIGYPDHWRDYSPVRIEPGDLVGNVDRCAIFESRRQLAKIGKPVDRTEWEISPTTVDAYYDPQLNDINFPAGVLQPPLFDPKMDDAPNYGNTGATIGHELTHAFDDEGRQFDFAGNLKDWWTKKDAAEFERRAACVVDQYSGYTAVDEIKVNGKLTLGENVADLGGTILAYMAWKHATRGQNLQPEGGFTPDQRFFVGMAQWACGEERPENKRLSAQTDEHAPDQYRINGVVSDMPEFAQVFSCKAGQPMVRQPVCRVW